MTTPATNKQVPDHSIMDAYNKQTYLGNQFVYVADSVAIASASEIPLFLLRNPAVSANSFPAAYQGLFLNMRKLVAITATQSAILRFYFNPTITGNGTAKTPANMRIANLTTSVGLLGQSPTVSANGTLFDIISSSSPVSGESNKMAIIDPGNSMLVTVQASANPTTISAMLGWYQL